MSRRFRFLYQPQTVYDDTDDTMSLNWMPYIPIRMKTLSGEWRDFSGIVDSGADTLVFPKRIADECGLPRLGPDKSSGIAGGTTRMYKSLVHLYMGPTNIGEDLGDLPARVISGPGETPILIGRKPIFEMYRVIFEEYNKLVIMVPGREVGGDEKPAKKGKRKGPLRRRG